jgi:hypothetical protein
LVHSLIIDDSRETIIQRKIEAMPKFFIRDGEHQEEIPISSVTKGHFQLQIKTLQNAPRDVEKLEWLLKKKKRAKEEDMHIQDTQRLFAEIEMLKVVLHLVS